MNKKKTGFIIISLAVAVWAMAVPAKPGPIVLVEEDGTERTVFLHGDEFFHYMTTEDGSWVEMQNGKLAKVLAMSEEDITARHDAQLRMMASKRAPAATNEAVPLNIAPRGLVILAQYSDMSFQPENTLTAFQAMFDSEIYSYGGATGSAKKYFEDQSFGQYSPVFDIVGPVTVSNTQRYYGTNDRWGTDPHVYELIIEACQIADTAWDVDFSIYDNDHDGFIDFVYVIYAGQGEADGGPTYTIWPHTSYIYDSFNQRVRLDGLYLNTYACSNELKTSGFFSTSRNGIGTFCHEFSHVLGLPDHYATNNSITKQTGYWDLMCSGSYNNSSNTPAGYTAYERFFMGWATPVILNDPVTIDSMKPHVTSGESYIITESGTSNLKGNDPSPTLFYMLENRKKVSWDAYIPGEGLMITRIDYDYSKWVRNIVNNSSARGYDIIEADGKEPSYPDEGYSGKQGDVFPYAEINSYSPFENCPITNIRKNDDGTIYFKFKGGTDAISPLARDMAEELYGDDFTEIVGVYDPSGYRVHDAGNLNDLPAGTYIIMLTNGKKLKGVKISIQ